MENYSSWACFPVVTPVQGSASALPGPADTGLTESDPSDVDTAGTDFADSGPANTSPKTKALW
jgi:hypothetical protein